MTTVGKAIRRSRARSVKIESRYTTIAEELTLPEASGNSTIMAGIATSPYDGTAIVFPAMTTER